MASRSRHAVLIHSRCRFYSVMPAFMPWNNSAQLPARLLLLAEAEFLGTGPLAGPCSGIGTDRQTHYKHRTFAQFARRRHIAAHHARELAGDGKSEPGAAEVLSGRSVSLAELLEQLGLLLCGHANAGVGDGELDEAAAIAHLACRKLDFTLFGKLAGIAEEIEQYLPQPHGVHGE